MVTYNNDEDDADDEDDDADDNRNLYSASIHLK